FDDYYKDISHLSIEERRKQNFDHPDAFDWPLILKQINELKNDRAIEKPIYDFNIQTRSKVSEIVQPKKLVILEGIMALENEKVRDLADLKIFVAASPERRFLRRLIRDHSERANRPFDFIISQYFATVKPMYDLYVKPTQFYADTIIYNEGTSEGESKAVNILRTLLLSVLNKD
ncbi:MAG: uridine kinase, partial [Firmicutes bacterium]|nr:uridine kinase [Candidatus Scatoplasma merdavium]